MEKSNEFEAIRLIPPAVYGLAITLGLLLEYLLPSPYLDWLWRVAIPASLLAISVWLILWTLMQFRKVDTPFDVRKETTTLITDGPFQFSRNPGYVALTLLYLAIGLALSNLWVISLSIPTVLTIDKAIIQKEETNLIAAFEDQYRNYQQRVRRWL